MVIRVRTSNNIQRWLRKFERDYGKLRKDVVDEPRLQAEYGQKLGVKLAPRDKHVTLIHAIDWKLIRKENSKGEAMIYVKPIVHPTDNRSRKTKGRASAYAAIHHSLPLEDFKNGQARTNDPHWGFTVRDEIKRRYGGVMRSHIQNSFKGNNKQ